VILGRRSRLSNRANPILAGRESVQLIWISSSVKAMSEACFQNSENLSKLAFEPCAKIANLSELAFEGSSGASHSFVDRDKLQSLLQWLREPAENRF
jgi:hypothetical protein